MASRILGWIDKRLPFSEFIKKHVTGYPTPRNLNYLWNFGSILGTLFLVQVITGIWLDMFYKDDPGLAFDSVQHIMRDVNFGWLIRYMHAIGPFLIFFAIYIHMARAIYYGSYKRPRELLWWTGVLIFLSFMTESFMGYLLPWGQMSYWAATAITNLFASIPLIGDPLTAWIRGDFAIGDATLSRFAALHTALLPVAIIGGLILLHLTALHKVGSNNPDGVELDKEGADVIPFAPYYIVKDLWFISLIFIIFFSIVFFLPDLFLEPANNEPANPLETPIDIIAEMYLLPFYSILKSIPMKIGGIIAMALSMLLLFFLPYLDRSKARSARYRPIKRLLTWLFFLDFILLGYVGSYPPDLISFTGLPMHSLGFIFTAYYFLYFITMPFISRYEPTKVPPDLGIKEEED